jgi:hypothetical protein
LTIKFLELRNLNCNMIFSPWRFSMKLYKILLIFRNNLFLLKFSCPQISKIHQWTRASRRREPLIILYIYMLFSEKSLVLRKKRNLVVFVRNSSFNQIVLSQLSVSWKTYYLILSIKLFIKTTFISKPQCLIQKHLILNVKC